jgi:hypothetical protein
MALLYELEYISVDSNSYDVGFTIGSISSSFFGSLFISDNVGWRTVYRNYIIIQGDEHYRRLFRFTTNPSAKILYVPPEIGPEGHRIGAFGEGGGITSGTNLLMVSADVSDEKLARILYIFDSVSFDQELKIIATYGFEGENFTWAGEPFNSFVQQSFPTPSWNNTRNLLNTMIFDGYVNRIIFNQYFDSDNPVYLFSKSGAARANIVPTYRDGSSEVVAHELGQWYADGYRDKLEQIGADYFYNVLQGLVDLESTWDDYIQELEDNGLRQYIEILEKAPRMP